MLNDYYQNIGMKGFIQRYGIVNAVKRGAFMFIKLHLVKDYEVRKVLWQKLLFKKLIDSAQDNGKLFPPYQ